MANPKRKEKRLVKQVKKNAAKINKAAQKLGNMSAAGLALKMASNPERKKKIVNYVKRRGDKPSEKLPELLTQAALLRNGEIEERAAAEIDSEINNSPNVLPENDYTPEIPDAEEIEEEIMQEEEEAFNFSGEADNFLDPATLAAIKVAGQKGINLVNKNRQAKGKPPVLSKVSKKLSNKLAGVKTSPAEDSELKKIGSELVDEITEVKKKQEIKAMMPQIILFALLLLGLGAGIAYAVKK